MPRPITPAPTTPIRKLRTGAETGLEMPLGELSWSIAALSLILPPAASGVRSGPGATGCRSAPGRPDPSTPGRHAVAAIRPRGAGSRCPAGRARARDRLPPRDRRRHPAPPGCGRSPLRAPGCAPTRPRSCGCASRAAAAVRWPRARARARSRRASTPRRAAGAARRRVTACALGSRCARSPAPARAAPACAASRRSCCSHCA